MKLFLVIVTAFIIMACNRETSNLKNTDPVFAYVDSIPVLRSEVDKQVGQELYDELCRIYLIREAALNNLIKDKLLQKEAERLSISADSLVNKYYHYKLESSFSDLSEKYNRYIKNIVDTTLIFNSVEDSIMFYKVIKMDSKEDLSNKLYKQHKIEIHLKAPVSPQLDLKYDIVHYRGNLNAKVTCMEISDFDCLNCKAFTPVMDSIYQKYKDKVRFGFTHYGSYASISAIASEAAGRQNKFWEMHDAIMHLPHNVAEVNEISGIAEKLGVEMNLFQNDLQDVSINEVIVDNLKKVEASGIYGTPTIAVNNRILFNTLSFNEIENLILEELNK